MCIHPIPMSIETPALHFLEIMNNYFLLCYVIMYWHIHEPLADVGRDLTYLREWQWRLVFIKSLSLIEIKENTSIADNFEISSSKDFCLNFFSSILINLTRGWFASWFRRIWWLVFKGKIRDKVDPLEDFCFPHTYCIKIHLAFSKQKNVQSISFYHLWATKIYWENVN